MVIGPLAQYPKLPPRPYFIMVLDTLEQSSTFSSMPFFGLVLDLDEWTSSSSVVPSFFSLFPCWFSISLTTQKFSTSYLRLHPLPLVYVDPFSSSYYVPVFYILVWFKHTATSLCSLLPTGLFWHVFLPHYFLGRVIVPYFITPPTATLPLDALPFYSVVWHLHCLALSSPSCAWFILDMASECFLHHDSKCIPYPVPSLCIHLLHTENPIILPVHGRTINTGSCILPGCGACTCPSYCVSYPYILVNISLSCFPQSILLQNKVWYIFYRNLAINLMSNGWRCSRFCACHPFPCRFWSFINFFACVE